MQEFIGKLKLEGEKGVLVLAHELVFENEVDAGGKNEKEEVEKILAKIPMGKNKMSSLHFVDQNKLKVFVTNRKLYGILIEELKSKGMEIVYVTAGRDTISPVEAKKIIEDKRLLEEYNFLKGYGQS